MKTIKFLLLFLIFSFSACFIYESDKELKSTMDKADTEEIPNEKIIDTSQKTIFNNYQIGSCNSLLLEIISERYGMISPQGKILNIRILKNGIAEYDYLDDSNNVLRKKLMFSKSQLNELLEILNSKEMASSKSVYTADNICIDTIINKKIIFCSIDSSQKKEILVNECGSTNFDEREKLPSKIINLFEKIDNVKNISSSSLE